jgi:D-glycero-alpha-D-manno-heptose-7-phosphate kinase
MIVTRTPVRIPLGGGGTDLPSYYTQYGGFLTSAAIDKYIYVTVNKRFEPSFRISYSQTEICDSADEIKHPIVREAVKLLGIERGIEITSIADVPSNTGLGTSSAFTVGLLNALHTYRREKLSAKELAEEACYIEIQLLREPIGKQDQYAAAFGGIISMEIDRLGNVELKPVLLSEDTLDQLESNTLLFYTGIRRNASEVLASQSQAASLDKEKVIESMHKIKDIGRQIKRAFEAENLAHFGELLDLHWQTKKQLSDKISQSQMDEWYHAARQNGALGGKIMGAGGGGFFMFYCNNDKNGFRKLMGKQGLKEMRFRIDFEGSKVLVNF